MAELTTRWWTHDPPQVSKYSEDEYPMKDTLILVSWSEEELASRIPRDYLKQLKTSAAMGKMLQDAPQKGFVELLAASRANAVEYERGISKR